MEWKGKVAVVTGGNSGIGLAIARSLAGEGLKLIIAARRQEKNEEVAARLRQEFDAEVLPVVADVSREEDCTELIATAERNFGGIDILVNNAGKGGGNDRIADSKTSDLEATVKTNLYSAYWCSREAFRRMEQNPLPSPQCIRGAIINIASVAGVDAWAGSGIYSISKHGMMALSKTLSDEGVEPRIRVAAVCPAMVTTPMTGVDGPDYISPEDIAETVLYLLRLRSAAWPTDVVVHRRGA